MHSGSSSAKFFILTYERGLLENGFRDGALSVLCATSTLAAGVAPLLTSTTFFLGGGLFYKEISFLLRCEPTREASHLPTNQEPLITHGGGGLLETAQYKPYVRITSFDHSEICFFLRKYARKSLISHQLACNYSHSRRNFALGMSE